MGSLTWTHTSSCYRGGEKDQQNRCQPCFYNKLSLINLNIQGSVWFGHRYWTIFESLLQSKSIFFRTHKIRGRGI